VSVLIPYCQSSAEWEVIIDGDAPERCPDLVPLPATEADAAKVCAGVCVRCFCLSFLDMHPCKQPDQSMGASRVEYGEHQKEDLSRGPVMGRVSVSRGKRKINALYCTQGRTITTSTSPTHYLISRSVCWHPLDLLYVGLNSLIPGRCFWVALSSLLSRRRSVCPLGPSSHLTLCLFVFGRFFRRESASEWWC